MGVNTHAFALLCLPSLLARSLTGFVSKAGTGIARANNDKQFLFLNGRPVDVPKVCVCVSSSPKMHNQRLCSVGLCVSVCVCDAPSPGVQGHQRDVARV